MYRNPPLVHLVACMGHCFCVKPWQAFKESTVFAKSIRAQNGNIKYWVDVEMFTAGNNMELPFPPGQSITAATIMS